ncbi:MAG: TauD/TfdA family dioxygenase [Proteobacteria bacterium]|nr:TauD/TfdA family dioxygenase [Pseudomonadota bacterium]MBI3496122.1 TauD/TfdA family dioxygenase [Pseudomonadota bacterium]
MAYRAASSPAAWHGAQLGRDDRWIRTFTPAALDELHRATKQVIDRGIPLYAATKTDFPLDRAAEQLALIGEEIENGRGLLLLRGIEARRYSKDELRQMFWGMSLYLGTAVPFAQQAAKFDDVMDFGDKPGTPFSRGNRTRAELMFHTDTADITGLLCLSTARQGGISKVASSITIHNEMLKRRPDLLELLFEPYHSSRNTEERPGEPRYYTMPVFGMRDGWFASHISRRLVRAAQEFPEAPRLRPEQAEALELHAAIAEECCLHFALQPGDIEFFCNHTLLHSRTEFFDGNSDEQRRHLIRIWISTPNSRPLPESFKVLYGRVGRGELRGGHWRGDHLPQETHG